MPPECCRVIGSPHLFGRAELVDSEVPPKIAVSQELQRPVKVTVVAQVDHGLVITGRCQHPCNVADCTVWVPECSNDACEKMMSNESSGKDAVSISQGRLHNSRALEHLGQKEFFWEITINQGSMSIAIASLAPATTNNPQTRDCRRVPISSTRPLIDRTSRPLGCAT